MHHHKPKNKRNIMIKNILKFLGYSLILLIVLLSGLIAYSYYLFNYSKYDDSFEIDSKNLTYYSPTSVEAQNSFVQSAKLIHNSFPQAIVGHFQVPSKTDTSLKINYLYIPAAEDSSNLIIISSGLHGVESFVGSAMQQLFLKEFVTSDLVKNTGVLLIHGINPYGFKYSRRVTENNVDLNRNSYLTDESYQTVNEGYPLVKDFINPPGPLNMQSFGQRFFYVNAIAQIIESSMPALRQAVLQGQYQFAQGLYFGGFNQEPQIDSLIPVISEISNPYKSIMTIDLHTGYGERAKLHLFPNPVEAELKKRMENLFSGYSIDWGDNADFYTVTGDFVGMVGNICKGKNFIPMTFEYGTLNSQTTFGSLKSIQIMVAENQGAQYGYLTEKDKATVNELFMEMYYPSSPAWRSHCIEQTRNIFKDILPKYVNQDF